MHLLSPLAIAGALVAAPFFSSPASGADSAARPTAPRPTSSKGGAAGRILPDPALLDGSTHPAAKKSEHGMIGDFELPGDENARGDKVGGQGQPQQQGGGQQQQGNMPMGVPSGGGGGQQGQSGQQAGGSQQSAAGQQAGGPQGSNPSGNPPPGGGQAGAQPQGVQVAELGGDASSQQGGGGVDATGKPQQVSIGDKAMRIENSAATQAGVVGGQQQIAGNTQQHEKGTGTGGKGPTGASSPNRVEKGRAIPAGL